MLQKSLFFRFSGTKFMISSNNNIVVLEFSK